MIRFLFADNSLVAIKGSLGCTLAGTAWLPPGGDPGVASAALEDERTLDVSEEEASAMLRELGAAMPSFSA